MGGKVVALWLTCVYLTRSAGTLSHVDRYEVVKPHRLLGRQRRTPGGHQLYPDTIRYELPIDGRNLTIHLEKNRDLLGTGYTETYYAEDGRRVTSLPEEEHCYYHGYIDGMKNSSVSVGLCSGINGFLKTEQQVYVIEPLTRSDEGEHAVFTREQLRVSGTPSCGLTLGTSYDGDRGPKPANLFVSKSWKPKPSTDAPKFVELFVVVDNTEYKRYGSETKARVLGAVNHINKMYWTLNIRVVLVGLEIWSYDDHFDVDSDPETTLDRFLLWRQRDLLQRRKHDNAQFVTGKDFDGDTVGLANKFAMCTENSGGVNQDHHDSPMGLASTIAHEMGHNFGLSHDSPKCTCGPSHSNCVMADKLSTGILAFPEFFSDCSVEQLAEFMARAQPSCLSKPPSSVKTVAVAPPCGNRLLDAGEECDCGTAEECDNPCCDPLTCLLTQGSQCYDGPCCESCQLKQAGSVCRISAGECDLTDYCTGASAECPEDGFEMNGTPCYDQAEGYCHDGQCPTHEQHCWRLFGPGTSVGPDLCFDLNIRGEEGANCGKSKYGFTRCTPQNLKCGSIFCGGGGESITGKRADYKVLGTECKLAVDDDKTRNIDMVPNGARCGPNKVCLSNRCVDVSVYGVKEDCAKKCNNNGVCNHKKECHCNPGWAPPYCDIQYAELAHGQAGIVAGVCAVLFILLSISGGIVWRMCRKKAKKDNYTAKRKVHSAPNKLNTVFQQLDPKARPQISEPTLMESTAAQVFTPLTRSPSRAPPQPPQKFSAPSPTSQRDVTKPQPPCKPFPPPSQAQHTAAKLTPPPLPPAKPSPTLAARTKPCPPPQPPNRPKTKPSPHRPQ